MKSKTNRLPVLNYYSDRLTFGKYKGCSVRMVVEGNPEYIMWLVENDICTVSPDIQILAYDEMMKSYMHSQFDSMWDYMAD